MPSETTRLNLCLGPEVKRIVEQAADILGVSTTDFASATRAAEAQAVLDRHQRFVLNNADRDSLLEALASEEGPNEALVRAAQKFKEKRGG